MMVQPGYSQYPPFTWSPLTAGRAGRSCRSSAWGSGRSVCWSRVSLVVIGVLLWGEGLRSGLAISVTRARGRFLRVRADAVRRRAGEVLAELPQRLEDVADQRPTVDRDPALASHAREERARAATHDDRALVDRHEGEERRAVAGHAT